MPQFIFCLPLLPGDPLARPHIALFRSASFNIHSTKEPETDSKYTVSGWSEPFSRSLNQRDAENTFYNVMDLQFHLNGHMRWHHGRQVVGTLLKAPLQSSDSSHVAIKKLHWLYQSIVSPHSLSHSQTETFSAILQGFLGALLLADGVDRPPQTGRED